MYVKDLIKHLQKDYKPDDVIAYDIWTMDDVLIASKDIDIDLTDEEMIKVLNRANHNKDAQIGINWDVLTCYIREVESKRRK